MDFIEKTGKNVEEALNDALAELKTTAKPLLIKLTLKLLKKLKTVFLVCLPKKPK